MLFIVISILLLLGNQILTSILVFFPIHLVEYLSSLSWLVLGYIGLAFLGWCLGSDTISRK
ncbi:MAG: hypothetical protein QNJ70_20460 [Xenococcaceae cyanobacterium MO_207.B15]|nr:hypothetical protein [Xenococcaceae cyanobacterium MO_207.B15]MDJ0743150.1 hypothetical protein [Xenococcaceae cyanobacterium MO_167.B27]